MLLEIPLSRIQQLLGHDGSEIIFPFLKTPYRGFQIMEMQYVAMLHGRCLIPVAPTVEYQPERSIESKILKVGIDDWFEPISCMKALICGEINGRNHAVAYDGEMIYDPSGLIYPLDDRIKIHEYFMLGRIHENPIICEESRKRDSRS